MRTRDFCDIPVTDATELQHKVGQTNLNGHLKNNWLVNFKSIKIMKVKKKKTHTKTTTKNSEKTFQIKDQKIRHSNTCAENGSFCYKRH